MMKLTVPRVFVSSLLLAAAVAFVPACDTPPKASLPADVQSSISTHMHPALLGTVGEFCALIDSAPIRVEGWGIVGGLPNTGSPDMDPRIHELMLNRLLTIGVGMYSQGLQNVDPEAILNSREISVVEVRGVIPPLARRGSTFDLYINAIPGSGTTSIAGGLLWPTDLKQIGLTFEGNDTRTIASGRGPVFIPATLEAEADLAAGKTPPDLRRAVRSGRVIAGGICGDDRDARLQVYTPNPMRTRMIERAIVAHFPAREKAAVAIDQNIVELHIPAQYKDNPADFVDLVRHLYLSTEDPGVIEQKAALLVEALKDPQAPHRELGLALQGLGRSILPDYLEPNYTSSNQTLRFWCARAGACLQDVKGLATLQEMVRDPAHAYRRQALMALIEASRGQDTERATMALYDMIRSYNTDDRILAYHALLAIRSPAVRSYNVGRKFMLDIIPADTPPIIYVLESDAPRIALIGRDIVLPDGALAMSKDHHFNVIVDEADEASRPVVAPTFMPGVTTPATPKPRQNVRLHWLSSDKEALLYTDAQLPNIIARACWTPDPTARDYDPKAPFIGASYQRIAELLANMCAEKIINANFIVERSPDKIVNPTDAALSGRAEGSTLAPAPEKPKVPSDSPAAPAPAPAAPTTPAPAPLP
jgi:hypothetical protein